MFKIKLTKGLFCTIDEEDFSRLSKHSWCASYTGFGWYARAKIKGKMVYMHRVIMNAKKNQIVDHINGDTLDNRKENLRFVTASQNIQNSMGYKGSSKYKGVHYDRNKWRADIQKDKKRIRIGRYDSEIEAARAYDQKAIELFGEFAKINGV